MSDQYNDQNNQQFNNNYQQPNNGYQQPNGYQNNGYQQPNGYPNNGYQQPYGVARLLRTDRSLVKFILLSIITCGIYAIVYWSILGDDINMVATRRDGKKTMHFCLVYFLLGPITCSIMMWIWYHSISERIGDEARARGINTDFGASTFWLWYVLGSLIIVGPFIYMHKLCQTMNMICDDYNRRGF